MKNTPCTLILAPLQGFTDQTFRNIWACHFSGLDEALAPFISTMGQKRLKPSRIKDVDPRGNRALPVVPQILGNVAEDFIFLANHLHGMGHAQVNWNLGCPHSKIAKKRRGSGLLPHPDLIHDLLTRIIPGMQPSLSVKIRLGRKSPDELMDLLAVLNDHPLDEIILHPRTGVQMYEGRCDLDRFEQAASLSCHPLVYNGDITDGASFKKIQQRFPLTHRFMIGRGILANPFLAEEIKGLETDPDRRLERFRRFHDDLLKGYARIFSGPGHLIGRMKGFWNFWGTSFKNSGKPVKKILKSTTLAAYTHRVKAFFDAIP